MESPAAPENLSDEALEVWSHVVSGWDLDPRELAVLRMAVRAMTEAGAAEAQLEGTPLTIPSAHGETVKAHPAWAVVRAQRASARQLLMSIDLPEPEEPPEPEPHQQVSRRRRPPTGKNTRERRGG